MKKAISVLSAAVVLSMLTFTSCEKDDDPQNATTPNINGVWSMSENSQDFGTSVYNVSISDSSDASHKLIANMYGFNKKVYATVSGSSLIIPTQLVEGNSVSGNGSLVSASRINLTYRVQSSSSHTDTVTAVLTK